jgi:hypothetical protein
MPIVGGIAPAVVDLTSRTVPGGLVKLPDVKDEVKEGNGASGLKPRPGSAAPITPFSEPTESETTEGKGK